MDKIYISLIVVAVAVLAVVNSVGLGGECTKHDECSGNTTGAHCFKYSDCEKGVCQCIFGQYYLKDGKCEKSEYLKKGAECKTDGSGPPCDQIMKGHRCMKCPGTNDTMTCKSDAHTMRFFAPLLFVAPVTLFSLY